MKNIIWKNWIKKYFRAFKSVLPRMSKIILNQKRAGCVSLRKKAIKKTRVLLWKESVRGISSLRWKWKQQHRRLRCAFCSSHENSSPNDTRVGRSSSCMLGVSIAYTILNCGSARVFCCSTTAFVSTCDNTHAHTRISTRSWEKMLNFSRVLRSKFGWMEESPNTTHICCVGLALKGTFSNISCEDWVCDNWVQRNKKLKILKSRRNLSSWISQREVKSASEWEILRLALLWGAIKPAKTAHFEIFCAFCSQFFQSSPQWVSE